MKKFFKGIVDFGVTIIAGIVSFTVVNLMLAAAWFEASVQWMNSKSNVEVVTPC